MQHGAWPGGISEMQHGAWPGEAGDFSSSTLAPGEAASSAYPRCRRVQPDGSAFSTVRGSMVSSPERTSASRPVREADDFSSSTLAPGGRFQHIPAAAAFPAAAGPAGSAFSRYVAW